LKTTQLRVPGVGSGAHIPVPGGIDAICDVPVLIVIRVTGIIAIDKASEEQSIQQSDGISDVEAAVVVAIAAVKATCRRQGDGTRLP